MGRFVVSFLDADGAGLVDELGTHRRAVRMARRFAVDDRQPRPPDVDPLCGVADRPEAGSMHAADVQQGWVENFAG